MKFTVIYTQQFVLRYIVQQNGLIWTNTSFYKKRRHYYEFFHSNLRMLFEKMQGLLHALDVKPSEISVQ